MKIFQVHNSYRLLGGEDIVFENEKKLLEGGGHQVFQYQRDNQEIDTYSFKKKLSLFFSTTWSEDSYREIKKLLSEIKPDICHIHNYLPLISPSVFYACQDLRIPVVQTLHNYRLFCVNGLFFRNGAQCMECLNSSIFTSVKYACYRNSRIQSLAVAKMLQKHWRKGTWQKVVDAYICLNNWTIDLLKKKGIPSYKIYYKMNVSFLKPSSPVLGKKRKYFVFIGRLDKMKGIRDLLKVANRTDYQVLVIGEGPLSKEVASAKNVQFLGKIPNSDVKRYIADSIGVINPSILKETMGLVILEAFSQGVPVIMSDIMVSNLVKHNENGLVFRGGDSFSLEKQMQCLSENPSFRDSLAINAFSDYQNFYSPEKNLSQLENIYQKIIKRKSSEN